MRSATRNVTSALSCTGPGSGGASATSVPAFMSLRGLNGGHCVGKAGRGHRQRRLKPGERPRLHHFLVADLDAGRSLERLFVRDDVDRPKQAIALAGVDAALPVRPRAASARRTPAPRRNHTGCRDRDRAPRQSGSRRRGRPTTRRQATGTTRCAARGGPADRRPIELAARRRGRGRPARGPPREPSGEKRRPMSSNLLFRSLLDARVAVGRAGRLVSPHAWPAQPGPRGSFSFPPAAFALAIRAGRNLLIGVRNAFSALSPIHPRPAPLTEAHMQLIGMLDSPYVRRVAIALIVARTPFRHRPISLFRHIDQFSKLNPLLKAPTLVADDGTALMDSSVILEYLAGLDPRIAALTPVECARSACARSARPALRSRSWKKRSSATTSASCGRPKSGTSRGSTGSWAS